VDDGRIVQAMRWLFSAAKLVVEPSGAIAAAAALSAVSTGASGTEATVAVLSGGNVAAADYAGWIADSRVS